MVQREVPSRLQAGVDLFTEDLFTMDLVKRMHLVSKEERKALIKLIGSDGQRLEAGAALTAISTAIENPDEELTLDFVEALNCISKKKAFRIYALLPRFILPTELFPDCEEERGEFRALTLINLNTALWLLDWNSNGRYSGLISRLGINGTEKRAFVSEKLYALCAYMKINSKSKYIQTFSVPALWLMIEVSKCLNSMSEKAKGIRKKERYKKRQQTISAIGDEISGNSASPLPTRQADDNSDLLKNFYSYFMYEAQSLAKDHKDFDKLLLSNYLKAERTWGRSARDQKGVIGYF